MNEQTKKIYPPLTSWKITYVDGTFYKTNMAAGVALADAEAYFVNQRLEQPDGSMKLVTKVERIS